MISSYQASTSSRSVGQDASRPTSVKAGEKQYRSEMLFIGAICHWSDCHRESFLPIRCPDCHQQWVACSLPDFDISWLLTKIPTIRSYRFCSDHYKTGDHRCAQASATFLVPLCPLCHEPPKDWKRDEDPNIAMNSHLSPHPKTGQIECEAVDGQGRVRDDAKGRLNQQRREKKVNECNERKCKKLMIVPIKVSATEYAILTSSKLTSSFFVQYSVHPAHFSFVLLIELQCNIAVNHCKPNLPLYQLPATKSRQSQNCSTLYLQRLLHRTKSRSKKKRRLGRWTRCKRLVQRTRVSQRTSGCLFLFLPTPENRVMKGDAKRDNDLNFHFFLSSFTEQTSTTRAGICN